MFRPRRLGEFTLLSRLAVGGMAELFIAHYASSQGPRLVAVKQVLPAFADDPDFVTMFLDEVRLALQIRHPNVVTAFRSGTVESSLYLAMAYVEGTDLRAFSQALRHLSSPLTYPEIAHIGLQVARGLHHAHELRGPEGQPLNVIHRDVSPENIIVSARGEVKLLDFGIAKSKQSMTMTREGMRKGKLAYTSPEMFRGERPDRRIDLWSLGVVLWELCTGVALADEMPGLVSAEGLGKPTAVVPPSRLAPDLPPPLEQIILRAAEPHPEQRYQTADEVARALAGWLQSVGASPTPAGLAARMEQAFGAEFQRRRRKLRRIVEELGLPMPKELLEPAAPSTARSLAARDPSAPAVVREASARAALSMEIPAVTAAPPLAEPRPEPPPTAPAPAAPAVEAPEDSRGGRALAPARLRPLRWVIAAVIAGALLLLAAAWWSRG